MVQFNFGGSFGAPVLKWPVTRKYLVIGQNEVKFGTLLTHIGGTFYLVGFDVLFGGPFGALFLKYLVMLVTQRRLTLSSDSRTRVTHMVFSYLVVFKVILGSLRPFVSKWPVTRHKGWL